MCGPKFDADPPALLYKQCLSMTGVILLCVIWSQCCQVVSRVPMEVSALLMQRNLLAAHVSALDQLPPVIQEPRTCARCFEQTACALIHKVLPASPSALHLTPKFDDS